MFAVVPITGGMCTSRWCEGFLGKENWKGIKDVLIPLLGIRMDQMFGSCLIPHSPNFRFLKSLGLCSVSFKFGTAVCTEHVLDWGLGSGEMTVLERCCS
ncbi:hypothetical protein ACFX2K_020117 [Malus domestica]